MEPKRNECCDRRCLHPVESEVRNNIDGLSFVGCCHCPTIFVRTGLRIEIEEKTHGLLHPMTVVKDWEA